MFKIYSKLKLCYQDLCNLLAKELGPKDSCSIKSNFQIIYNAKSILKKFKIYWHIIHSNTSFYNNYNNNDLHSSFDFYMIAVQPKDRHQKKLENPYLSYNNHILFHKHRSIQSIILNEFFQKKKYYEIYKILSSNVRV